MHLVILSPEAEIFSGEVKSVTVPGANGSFQMLNNHAATVSALEKGAVKVVTAGGEKLELVITGGFVEMLNNEISLLVSGLEGA
ncbi:MAG: ATP synthase F1 subunit epsilon [Bacteroidetes bacterium]|nr:ATP synthase F1 subunit epsilon [Bacteroidota bacterium]